jgi:hypothetical protein
MMGQEFSQMSSRRVLPVFLLLSVGSVAADVVINEIMYNSPGSPDVEYVELYNDGPLAVDLSGWYLLDNDPTHPPCMLEGLLAPGEFLVVAGLIDLFSNSYPGVIDVNPDAFDSLDPGQGFSLGNGGDEVRLHDAGDVLTDLVAYGDGPPWPSQPDGSGPSLELVHPNLDNADPGSWGSSMNPSPQGTPGAPNSILSGDSAPSLTGLSRSVPWPSMEHTLALTARATDDEGVVSVQLYLDDGAGFLPEPMFDDGLHGDGNVNDATYGVFVGPRPEGTLVRYYVAATDTLAQVTFEPAGAPSDYRAYTVGHRPPDVEIHEILAANQDGLRDEAGEADDWIELRNRGAFAVDLGGRFLTNDLDVPRMWELPSLELLPGEHRIVWADGDEGQGELHANFTVPRVGGEIGLVESIDLGGLPIHAFTYGLQSADVSFGYLDDDSDAPEYIAEPTPNAPNGSSALFSPVCINEFLTTSLAGGLDDWVELYNRGDQAVDISGWGISDAADSPLAYTFPPGTILEVGGRLVVYENELGFGFSSTGDEVIMLSHADGSTGQDYFDAGPQTDDISQGRFPEGTANWHFFVPPSPSADNLCEAAGPSPGPVELLTFESDSVFSWEPSDGAQSYDVVRGEIDLLRATSGDLAAAVTDCLENNSPDATSWDSQVPAADSGRFYLIRATTSSCGFGTYDVPGPSLPTSRDPGIAAAAAPCP